MSFLFLLLIECTGKLVEPLLPDTPTVGDPDFETQTAPVEGNRSASAPPGRTFSKPASCNIPQMPRHTGPMNFNLIYQIVDGLLALTERFDDT